MLRPLKGHEFDSLGVILETTDLTIKFWKIHSVKGTAEI